MASLVLVAIASLLVAVVTAVPTISFPINSQVPPVARIGQPFSFVFSASTFSSSSELTYTLGQSPDWVSFDGKARRIYGTPKNTDVAAGTVVGVPVDIVATDDSGSVTMSATLVVSRNPPPTVSIPLAAQTPDFAPFSQPSSLIMRPDTSFAWTLASNTFTSASIYYAVMADNSPLPSWMTFDSAKLSFSGQTPPLAALVQTPQSFDFQLVASDVPGFSGASLPFSIVVGNHAVTAEESVITLNATIGERMSYKGLADSVKFDDQDAISAGVSVITTSGLPAWLTLNKSTWEISGTPPETAKSSNFTITMQDQHSDTLNLTVLVSVTDGLFVGDLPALNVTAGESFTFDLGNYLTSKQDLDVSVASNPTADWVKYDATKRVISGTAPSKLAGSQIAISIDVKSASSGLESTKQLNMSILRDTTPTTLITAPPRTATPTNSETLVYSGLSTSNPSASTAEGEPGEDDGKPSRRTILLAVLIPVLLLLLTLLGILAFCCYRRRKRPNSIDRRDISRPVPGSLTHSGSGSGDIMEQISVDSYDTEDELSPAAYLARDMSGPYFTDPSLLTPPPSRGGLHPSSGDAWPSSNAWPPSSAWRRSSNPYTPPKRPDIQSNLSAPNLHNTDSPTRAAHNRHIRNRTSRYRFSKVLNVDIPDSNIFSGDSTPDSSFFANTNFDSSPPLGGSTPPDRGTKLEDFMHADTIRRVPTESSSETPDHLAPPPLARLRTPAADTPDPPPRPFHPRRLFAPNSTLPPNIRSPSPPPDRRGGPLSSSPWTYAYDSLGLPRSSPPRSSVLRVVRPSVRAESSIYSSADAQATPSMSPARWPHPPSSQQRELPAAAAAVSRLSVSDDGDDDDGLPPRAQVSAEDVNEWIGVATSRYSKASSWLEAAAGFEGRSSQDVERDGSSSLRRPTTAGRSSGDYPVYI
ncbi:hypothetical protein CONLIGDRAFT_393960 [Coniochaeta ligniaria NRRL 30616]|uniref:Dystroglycan-type cadherin-like domain-containing protein n=1 Tax=Coniochaeta ligniaria NRRL 30616 TaxID=1408157 RepID=A0A1J7INS3_9PEZI|nr:hypothetical protein CONLIGDRAFT_393960 [Coniochaeta ligniaria NRRL 30616]